MIRLFYAVAVMPARSDDGRPLGAIRNQRLHETAWKLLHAALRASCATLFPRGGDLPAIVKGTHGKPSFADPSLPQFSLSHSGRIALCALSEDGPVGVDVQEPLERIEVESISARFFHPEERAFLAGIREDEARKRAFFRIFSCKEAYVKMTGDGIYREFRSFSVLPAPWQPCPGGLRGAVLSPGEESAGALFLPDLRDHPALQGHALAVCAPTLLSAPPLSRIELP